MKLFRRKHAADLQAEAKSDQRLKRALGPVNLTALGIGAIIGAGIFVLTGHAAAKYAGPAIAISFVLAGLACAFAGLCYAEFAAMIPMSGSAYTYAYATLGEFIAWIIGWDLILEYLFAASTVAVGWSGYVVSFLKDFGIVIPPEFSAAIGTHLIQIPVTLAAALKINDGWTSINPDLLNQIKMVGSDPATLTQVTAIFNVPAMLIILAVTLLLVLGIKESASFNNVIVAIKMMVILTFIAVGLAFINRHNWHPFVPPATGPGEFGWGGVLPRRGRDFLRLYRLRRRIHRRAGGEKSAARHAHRYARLARHLHRALHRRRAGAHRRGELSNTQCPRAHRRGRGRVRQKSRVAADSR